jgi:DivIVA domain-containing protein
LTPSPTPEGRQLDDIETPLETRIWFVNAIHLQIAGFDGMTEFLNPTRVAQGGRARGQALAGRAGAGAPFGELRHYVPADILNVSFPSSVRGYDRRAVDAYLKRVNQRVTATRPGLNDPRRKLPCPPGQPLR